MGTRPGSVPAIEDRVVLNAIVFLMASTIDEKFPDGVYSYRLKDPPERDSIFKESDILDLPYLKTRTISRRLDIVEPWYALWPEFERKSREAFEEDGYGYLAISDISAYYENIQLAILRDDLLGHFPRDQPVVNLLISFLETWATKTPSGRTHWRGIPQGTQISSFLGNLFLLPLDDVLQGLAEKTDSKYYRYMDDVRFFARSKQHSRLAIFEMDRIIRARHLNVQSAKTRILDQSDREISQFLVDRRLDLIDDVLKRIDDEGSRISERTKIWAKKALRTVAIRKTESKEELPLKGRRKGVPLRNKSVRLFQRWMTAHMLLESDDYIELLVKEIQINPEQKLTRRLVSATKQFPKRMSISRRLSKYLRSEFNIFPHQEAEIIRTMRYLSRVEDDIRAYAEGKLFSSDANFYVKMQSAYLLSRIELDLPTLQKCLGQFRREGNPFVQSAISGLLMQTRGNLNERSLHEIMFHPNDIVRRTGNLFWRTKNDERFAKTKAKFVFEKGCDFRI